MEFAIALKIAVNAHEIGGSAQSDVNQILLQSAEQKFQVLRAVATMTSVGDQEANFAACQKLAKVELIHRTPISVAES